jgi:hypothetical protein
MSRESVRNRTVETAYARTIKSKGPAEGVRGWPRPSPGSDVAPRRVSGAAPEYRSAPEAGQECGHANNKGRAGTWGPART